METFRTPFSSGVQLVKIKLLTVDYSYLGSATEENKSSLIGISYRILFLNYTMYNHVMCIVSIGSSWI